MKKTFAALITVSLLTGCATVINGPNQTIMVSTLPTKDAQCSLENDKGKWQINTTPSPVVVRRSDKNLLVTCKTAAFDKTSQSIKSEQSMIVYANFLFTGPVGGFIDRNNGSAYEYPSEIRIPLKVA